MDATQGIPANQKQSNFGVWGNEAKVCACCRMRIFVYGFEASLMLVDEDAISPLALQRVGVALTVGRWLDSRRFEMEGDWSLKTSGGGGKVERLEVLVSATLGPLSG